MKIQGFTHLFGPNVYTDRPLVGMLLDLEHYAERPSDTFPGFADRLAARLPGLIEHRCTPGCRGGFLERLRRGTYLGHVCEHVALEWSAAVGEPVHFGRTVSTSEPNVYLVLVAYESAEAMRHLLRAAVSFVQAVIDDRPFDIESALQAARIAAAEEALGPSTRCIVEAALARGIPVRRVKDCLVQLGWGIQRRFVDAALTSLTSQVAVDIACDKALTKQLLHEASIPVPRGVQVCDEAGLLAALNELQRPVVIKPLDANHGKGVSLNVAAEHDARVAFRLAREHCNTVVVEEQLRGRDFRVLVIAGRVVAAAERIPAHVVGDGRSTIGELVDQANRDPRRGIGHTKPLTVLALDAPALACLEKNGRSPRDVPAAGEIVYLRENANLSTGGEAHDVTAQLHPSVASVCVRAARVIGLDIAGIDLVAEAIDRPLRDGEGIVEVNAAPGLRMHLFPCVGQRIDPGPAIIDWLYPGENRGRIPIVAVTGTNGKTTVARLVARMLREQGRRVGLTTTDGIYLDGEWLGHSDASGPHSANVVLSDPSIEVAVLETARGGIVRRGLAFDWCDVGIITNIREDHIGQDGIRDIEDLIWIKSIIAERVREGGTLVINADDPAALSVLQRPRTNAAAKRVVLYALSPDNPAVREHVAGGGDALFVRDDVIVHIVAGVERRVVAVSAIPIAFGGLLRYNAGNCMAAIAAAQALSVDPDRISFALQAFDLRDNPGRGTVYTSLGRYVMLDYGHNPDAFTAAGQLRRDAAGHRLIGVVGVPGDRADEVLRQCARAVAGVFDELIIREDGDLRGREPGETARLLCEEIRAARPELPCQFVPEGEIAAMQRALEIARPGDLVVVFYEELEPLLEALTAMHATPVTASDFIGTWTAVPVWEAAGSAA